MAKTVPPSKPIFICHPSRVEEFKALMPGCDVVAGERLPVDEFDAWSAVAPCDAEEAK